MAVPARLIPSDSEAPTDWPWHRVTSSSLRASALFSGDRRMEAEGFLTGGFATRLAIESKPTGWTPFGKIAHTWQPSRLKGIQVGPKFGVPFLAATQVYDVRPVPRKWLSLHRTGDHAQRFVEPGTILVTCSGNVGRATLAHATLQDTLVSHDLLRIEANEAASWGWLYAYLRAPTVREMMKAVQYGHIIKHLEIHHMDTLPLVKASEQERLDYVSVTRSVVDKRSRAFALTVEAEREFTEAFGTIEVNDYGERGFTIQASKAFSMPRRRFDAWHHSPWSKAIVDHLSERAAGWASISELGFEVWLPARFRRIPAERGVPFLDSSDVFEMNPDVTKRVADINFGDRHSGRVEPGWILLSRSGQIYGLNGSATLAGRCHAGKIVSDHIIRIAPGADPKCRAGYLLVAMTHPQLGRPRVKSLAYGSSIPEIDVYDAERFRVPRLDKRREEKIADCVEEAARLRDDADQLEDQAAAHAEAKIAEFIA